MWFHDPETDRCLYRTAWVSGPLQKHDRFEKFIIDAFTGETLAQYKEENGQVVEGDLASFSTAIHEWFPEAK